MLRFFNSWWEPQDNYQAAYQHRQDCFARQRELSQKIERRFAHIGVVFDFVEEMLMDIQLNAATRRIIASDRILQELIAESVLVQREIVLTYRTTNYWGDA